MKTYKVVDIVVNHEKLGEISKQAVCYMADGKEETREFYSGDPSQIKEGYLPEDDKQPIKKIDIKKLFESATLEEIEFIKKILLS